MAKREGETHNTHFAAIKPFFVGSAKKMPPSSLEAEYHYTRAEQKKTYNFPQTKKLEKKINSTERNHISLQAKRIKFI